MSPLIKEPCTDKDDCTTPELDTEYCPLIVDDPKTEICPPWLENVVEYRLNETDKLRPTDPHVATDKYEFPQIRDCTDKRLP
jgi:hypothetical protein